MEMSGQIHTQTYLSPRVRAPELTALGHTHTHTHTQPVWTQ